MVWSNAVAIDQTTPGSTDQTWVANNSTQVSKVDFSTGTISLTPVAFAAGVYSWRTAAKWLLPNFGTYQNFIATSFNISAMNAVANIRVGEQTRLADWVGNATTAGVFTQKGYGISNSDGWTDLFLEVIVVFGATAFVFTITYLDETNTSRTTTVTIPLSTVVNARINVPLNAASLLMKQITNITCATSPAAAAEFNIWGFHRCAQFGSPGVAGTGTSATIMINNFPMGYSANNRNLNTYVAIEHAGQAATAFLLDASVSGIFRSAIYNQ
jgi:hypothetical protein